MIFSVDTEVVSLQLPDYHEIIEHPMDFGTLRKKLDEGLYSNLEELEVGNRLPSWILVACSTRGFNFAPLMMNRLLWRQLWTMIFQYANLQIDLFADVFCCLFLKKNIHMTPFPRKKKYLCTLSWAQSSFRLEFSVCEIWPGDLDICWSFKKFLNTIEN